MLNTMTIKEMACIFTGLLNAGFGDAEVRICIDHGDQNRDMEYDLGIDRIEIGNLDHDIDVALKAYLFDSGLSKMLERFEHKELFD